jgi:cell fate regulator YaaT (PSP1 superfamily)
MTEEIIDNPVNNKLKIAGVRFRDNWKVYDFDATDLEVAIGDNVIVDSERGAGFASIVRIRKEAAPVAAEAQAGPPSAPPVKQEVREGIEIEIDGEDEKQSAEASKNQGPKTLRKILRKATQDDMAKEEKNREREAEAFSLAQDMIAERELAMKLIRVEYTFDASRATFFFFSENRIDFRELVKDLAYKLKSRIEMRQIGVRDVARMIGGFGPCGRELCCSSFLKNFEPVSIRMAKKQEMVLNPAKISGVCGRLLCCLSYEYEMYEANKKDLADMRQSAVKEKKDEEEKRMAEERKLAEEQRAAEEKKHQEERRQQQDERRTKQKEGGQKTGGRPEKKKGQQEKKQQPGQAGQPKQQQRQQQARPERPQPKEQKEQPPVQKQPQEQQGQHQQEGDKQGKKKRRRFWRRKKKGNQEGGENKPAPQNSNAPGAGPQSNT